MFQDKVVLERSGARVEAKYFVRRWLLWIEGAGGSNATDVAGCYKEEIKYSWLECGVTYQTYLTPMLMIGRSQARYADRSE